MLDFISLSKTVSHALRHEPWLYELELDDQGWVPIEALLRALGDERTTWKNLTPNDLASMIERSEKKRHEIRDGKIRAAYGHSTPQRLLREPAEPPTVLYHGTAPETAEIIKTEGLRPMGRQYVHLSADLATAQQVGSRKAKKPIVLTVQAKAAHAAGVAFYRGGELVWLADVVPPAYISAL